MDHKTDVEISLTPREEILTYLDSFPELLIVEQFKTRENCFYQLNSPKNPPILTQISN